MASYGGVNVFGTGVSFSTTDRPRELQLNSYFGLSGIESLDGGSRGRLTTASGVLFAPSLQALASLEANLRNLSDGLGRDLVDETGTRWQNVLLESFQPIGQVRRTREGLVFRLYRARFIHLN